MAETMEDGMIQAPPSHVAARQFDEVVRREREDIALPGWRFVRQGDCVRDDSEDIGMESACSSAVQKRRWRSVMWLGKEKFVGRQ